MLPKRKLEGCAGPSSVQPGAEEAAERRGEATRVLVAQLPLTNPFPEQIMAPSPGGPCPDSSEFFAANISLFASRLCVLGRVLTADRLLNVGWTLGATRRTAIDK